MNVHMMDDGDNFLAVKTYMYYLEDFILISFDRHFLIHIVLTSVHDTMHEHEPLPSRVLSVCTCMLVRAQKYG